MDREQSIDNFQSKVRELFQFLVDDYGFVELPPKPHHQLSFENDTYNILVEGVHWGEGTDVSIKELRNRPGTKFISIPLWSIIKIHYPNIYLKFDSVEGQIPQAEISAKIMRENLCSLLSGDTSILDEPRKFLIKRVEDYERSEDFVSEEEFLNSIDSELANNIRKFMFWWNIRSKTKYVVDWVVYLKKAFFKTIVLLAFLIAVFFVYVNSISSAIPFNTEIWLYSDKNTKYRMAKYLEKESVLHGKSTEEVIDMLGEPNIRNGNYLFYNVDQPYGYKDGFTMRLQGDVVKSSFLHD